MVTAKKAALWLLCLLGAAAAGCAWNETRREYPRSAFRDAPAGAHAHHHGPAANY